MTSTIVGLLSFTTSAALAVVCAALFLMILWQGVGVWRNLHLALTMLLFSVGGVTPFFFHFVTLTQDQSLVPLAFSNTLYGFSILSLFAFLNSYVGLPPRTQRIMLLLGLLPGLAINPLIWSGQAYQNVHILSDGMVTFDVTLTGIAVMIWAVIYELISIGVIYRQHNDRSRRLWWVCLLIPLEVPIGNLGIFQALPLDALTLLVISVYVGREYMLDQILKPMMRLNVQLALANLDLWRANRKKSAFLAVMSHELRTPLNSIIGYTEMVLKEVYGPLNERQINRIEKIHQNGQQLLALINDILDLSKIEAGQMKLQTAPVVVVERVSGAVRTIQYAAQQKGLHLEWDIPADLPPVIADGKRLQQVLENLLANAVRFTAQGSITIRARAIPGQEVQISVIDTGIGIDPQRHETIFEPSQIRTNRGSSTGTGLGLALCRQLVLLHGGRIWMESEGIEGKGSAFHFTLPVAPPLIKTPIPARVAERTA